MTRAQLLHRLEAAWAALQASYAGLPEAWLTEPGVGGDWSVKDTLAHVTTWEEEALRHLPTVLAGGRPLRYADTHGGIDAFNAQMMERNRARSLADVRRQMDETHRRLVAYIERVPDAAFARETRFRRRLRLDTYSHYPIHTELIHAWREGRTSRRDMLDA